MSGISLVSAGGRFLHIYCDESRWTADRYMVIGGVITLHEDETFYRLIEERMVGEVLLLR